MSSSTVLVAPLNWGLGHATRCAPIIHRLLNEGQRVVIAADGDALKWLQSEFPDLDFITLPGLKIRYSTSKTQVGAMLWQIPFFINGIIREHQALKKIIRHEGITQVISDNRFGLWSKRVKSVYITHQLMIKAPAKWMEPILWYLHRCIINRYDECWIPDIEGEGNLSGDLSHKYPLPRNARFIGWLSRFSTHDTAIVSKHYQNLGIVSGPEPQRTLFEQQLIEQFRNCSENTLIIRGKPESDNAIHSVHNIDLVSHLSTAEMQAYILDTPSIICRSGYSTLMDLKVLGKTATLIPTPGQTEQEYLATLHHS